MSDETVTDEMTEPPDWPMAALQFATVADLQDNLLVAQHDLDRLQRLLADASHDLLHHFHAAAGLVRGMTENAGGTEPACLPEPGKAPAHETLQHLSGAITALQFQDMASQLITHTAARLRNCADRLVRESMADDDEGEALVAEAPTRPNPVTQDEMDAGSIELF